MSDEVDLLQQQAEKLFAHLPDHEFDDQDVLEDAAPHYKVMSGRLALHTGHALYWLADDGVVRYRPLGDGREEVVAFRDRERVHRGVVGPHGARPSDAPGLN